jgi:hypothetical protein
MALHDEFLEHADRLATQVNASQADLRRAVSGSYYAVFHLLIAEATQVIAPASPSGLAARVGRSFSHSNMQDVCKAFATQSIRPPLSDLINLPIETSLTIVAGGFIELQEQRIRADYDPSFVASELWARNAVQLAIKATSEWRTVKGSANANVFLTALAFHRLWGRGA